MHTQALFQADHIAFSIFPVTTWAEIRAVCAAQLADSTVRKRWRETKHPRSPSPAAHHDTPALTRTPLPPSPSQGLKTAWFINCAGTEDVRSLLGLDAATRAVIVDARRPLHHSYNNEGDADAVVLAARGTGGDGEGGGGPAVPEPDGASDFEEEDEEEDEEQGGPGGASPSGRAAWGGVDADGGAADRPAQRRRLGSASPSTSAPGDDAEGEDADDDAGGARLAAALARSDARRAARARARAIRSSRRAYYAKGTWWGLPASATLFELARALRADGAHALWLAIVGVTDAFLGDRLARPAYDELVAHYETLAAVLPGADEADVEVVPVDDNTHGADGGGGATTTTLVRRVLYGKLTPHDDLRVPLLRQWTAWDALVHAPALAVPLATWTQAGRKKLEALLATAGPSLAHCRTDSRTATGRRSVEKLAERLPAVGPAFRIGPLGFRSFALAWAGGRVAAADAAAAAAALLEVGDCASTGGPSSAANHAGDGGCSESDPWADTAPTLPSTSRTTAGAPVDPAPPPDPGAAAAASSWARAEAASARARFWRAWNAAAVRDGGEMEKGLELARGLRRAVLADGGGLLTRRRVRESPAGRFRWADLSGDGGGAAHAAVLARPGALARLAAFVRDAAAAAPRAGEDAPPAGGRSSRPRSRARRPLVLIGPRGPDGRCDIVAVCPPPLAGSAAATPPANPFGRLFARAAASAHTPLAPARFDAPCVRVPAADLARFMRELTLAAAAAGLSGGGGGRDVLAQL
jgi:cell division control protein 45